MLKQSKYIYFVLKQLLVVTLLFEICRLFFLLFNLNYFNETKASEIVLSFFYGLRFDTCAILFLNSIYILLFLLPLKLRDNVIFIKTAHILFISSNILVLFLDCIDWPFFQFSLKRSTSDLFTLLTTGGDTISLLPTYLKQYWFIVIIWLGLGYILLKLSRKNELWLAKQKRGENSHLGTELSCTLITLAIAIIGLRGGIQHRPIATSTAIEYTEARNIPLYINTPFSIMKSLKKSGIKETNYFNKRDLVHFFNPQKEAKKSTFTKKNVVILILESFSKEYVGYLNNGIGYTPFLDSLMQHSLVFPNGYANAKRSVEGIPAIVAGIPALMDEPFASSIYQTNEITSLASILKENSYSTSFFHGGANGTMNFNSFTKIAGFEKYYGKTEYNNNDDFDGKWGIFDEPFMQYFANEINKKEGSFLAVLFSLSSHHPYSIPLKHKGKFKEGPLEIHKSIGYTDYSLKQFFNTAKKMKWYENTLFVLVADHTSISKKSFYQNRMGSYQIPIVYFAPDNSLDSINKTITQQIDITPTLLHLLSYNKPYFCFGNNALDSNASHYAVNYINNTFYYVNKNYALEFDGTKTTAIYDLKADSLLQHNLYPIIAKESKESENRLKALIQTYNNRIINNRLK